MSDKDSLAISLLIILGIIPISIDFNYNLNKQNI